ncbi:MAG: tetratricopeptide repeat protein [Clostridia bacterium]|nr:tetratricopeptide repeat protein [Clostridia bacterium]
MAEFLYRTRGNSSPKGRSRVYFTSHPDDIGMLDRICEDIFASHSCAVYYTEDMNAPYDEVNLNTDLASMNLFVIPVTLKLLLEPCRALDTDLRYAREKGISILPIMMKAGLDAYYSLPDKFGELQYLCPESSDGTEIPYSEKLKKHLESVLVSDELAMRVRAAFDAYIFLSYRKVDRQYANELMRLIHSKPEYRDIAIWYDEFLIPGESFKENIERAINSSKLFTLLVTPNLLEEPKGKPNFVMRTEYPIAKEAGIDILPAKMVDTDEELLGLKFPAVPACADTHDEAAFNERLAMALINIARDENDCDPEHNFLIGLAYRDGIDVEVDRERALSLITSSAEAGLPAAMEALYCMYYNGTGVAPDYRQAAYWCEKYSEHCSATLGDGNGDTLYAFSILAFIYHTLGEFTRALEILERIYPLCRTSLGDDHEYTLAALGNMANIYGELGKHDKALELNKTAYEQSLDTLGEDHPHTVCALNNLAMSYSNSGKPNAALKTFQSAYSIGLKALGEDHEYTLTALNNVALSYHTLGNYSKALEIFKSVYELDLKSLGELHPNTQSALSNIAVCYLSLGKYADALSFVEKAYRLSARTLGEKHPDTIRTLDNLATTYANLKRHKEALIASEKAYKLCLEALGEKHPDTIIALGNLADRYAGRGMYKKAIELCQRAHELCLGELGRGHPYTSQTLHNLGCIYYEHGKYQEAQNALETAYRLRQGGQTDKAGETASALITVYEKLGKRDRVIALISSVSKKPK